jgi:uncharacterized protein YacL (UPF0231 family)
MIPVVTNEGMLLDQGASGVAAIETVFDDSIAIPDWFNLEIYENYSKLNPVTKREQQEQQAWHNC